MITPKPRSITDQLLSNVWRHRGIIIGVAVLTTLLVVVCGYIGGVQYQMLKSGYGVDYSLGASMALGLFGPGKAQTLSAFVAMQFLHVIFLYIIPAKRKRIKDERNIKYSAYAAVIFNTTRAVY